MNDQIKRDITQWSRDQLANWYQDSVMRYKAIDLSTRDANVETLNTLISATVFCLHSGGFPIEKIGELIRLELKELKLNLRS